MQFTEEIIKKMDKKTFFREYKNMAGDEHVVFVMEQLKKQFVPFRHGKEKKHLQEIVIEYLSGGWVSDPKEYLNMRYGIHESYVDLVVNLLRSFSFLQED